MPTIFPPLVNVNNLKKIVVIGNLTNGSLTTLFERLVPDKMRNLEELDIAIVEPEELRVLTKISSLKFLTCGFFCSQNWELLAELKQLESLNITVHPKGSLTNLFNILADQNILRSLIIQRTELTSEEVVAVSGTKSLKILQLGRPYDKNKYEVLGEVLSYRICQKCRSPIGSPIEMDHMRKVILKICCVTNEADMVSSSYFDVDLSSQPDNLELLAHLPQLTELGIHFLFKARCIEGLINALALRSYQTLCKFSLTLSAMFVEDQFVKSIAKIALLQNLSELHIENNEGFSLTELFDLLKTSAQLRSLILEKTHINFEETLAIGNIKRLQKLVVGFSNDASFEVLGQISDLEYLEIISVHNKIEHKMRPIIKSCKKLRSILLNHLLTNEFTNSILDITKSERDPNIQPPLKLCCPGDNSLIPERLNGCDATFLDIEQPPEESWRKSDELELHAVQTPLSASWW
ncbi:uncharacterized protein LOC108053530 [Drosophila rhopaloa]|uniref:Uncharacterized protein LOC108053530 n=1 Tax=Drosophila rhopaloa TaxID=1041015 RepID=A0A6P4FW53_DRORH|nr:uncharacterized protein LOC108053530 [Drosophila rhopaloa]